MITYIIAIDTDSYAGNFEREMCAYITNQVGGCGVGQEIAEAYLTEYSEWFADHIRQEDEEHDNCYRPCALARYNGQPNTVEIFMDELPPDEVLASIIERAQHYCAEHSRLHNAIQKWTRVTTIEDVRCILP